jgi:hypothetical protein
MLNNIEKQRKEETEETKEYDEFVQDIFDIYTKPEDTVLYLSLLSENSKKFIEENIKSKMDIIIVENEEEEEEEEYKWEENSEDEKIRILNKCMSNYEKEDPKYHITTTAFLIMLINKNYKEKDKKEFYNNFEKRIKEFVEAGLFEHILNNFLLYNNKLR